MKQSKTLPQISDIFNDWTILSLPENTNSVSKIEVQCKCGKYGSVRLHKLIKNKSTKCKSCSNKINGNHKTKPYSLISLQPPKDFSCYKEHIFVSKEGEIFSTKSGLLSPGKGGTNSEYLRVDIGYRHEYVHRLVALTYIPIEESRWQVNHKDKNTLNNCIENLEWVTPTENIRHAYGDTNYKS